MDRSPKGLGFAALTLALAVPSAIAAVAAWGGALAQVDPLSPSLSQVDNLIAVARDHAEARGVDPEVLARFDRRGQRTLATVKLPTGPSPVRVPETNQARHGFSFDNDAGYSFNEEMAKPDEGFAFEAEPLPAGTRQMPPNDGGVW